MVTRLIFFFVNSQLKFDDFKVVEILLLNFFHYNNTCNRICEFCRLEISGIDDTLEIYISVKSRIKRLQYLDIFMNLLNLQRLTRKWTQ